MPNVGRPSAACFACKRMKVKCDEKKPACDRCTRANRECPGYGPKPDMFRYTDPKTGVTRKRRSSGKKSESPDQENAIEILHADQTPAPEIASTNILVVRSCPSSTIEEWTQRAICLFFWTHTSPCSDPSGGSGCLDFLEDYVSSGVREAYLYDALHAIAFSNLAHRVPTLSWIPEKALSYRAQALRSIQKTLCNAEEAKKDDVLIALFLLERAELLDMDNQSWRIWQHHSAGMAAILRLRGPAQFDHPIGAHMFRWINPQLSAKDVSFGTSYSINDAPGHTWLQKTGKDQTADGAKLVSLVQSLRQTLARDPSDIRYQQGLYYVLGGASAFSEALASFDASHFAPVGKAVETVGFAEDGKIFPFTVYAFSSIFQAMRWALHWIMRLRAYRLMLDCMTELKTLEDSVQSIVDEEALHVHIYDCAKNVADTIPCLMSDVRSDIVTSEPSQARGSFQGAMIAMNALNTLGGTPELDAFDPDFRSWVFNCMLRLKNEFGIKQAQAFYNLFKSGLARAHPSPRLLLMRLDLMNESASIS